MASGIVSATTARDDRRRCALEPEPVTVAELRGRLHHVAADGRSAYCPAHETGEDAHRRSLSIAEGRDGKVLLTCHAGCSLDAIVGALNISKADLFSTPLTNGRTTSSAGPSRRQDGDIVATYDYHDQNGIIVFQAVRYAAPKDFRLRRADPARPGRYVGKVVGEVPLVPYRLPEVREAVGLNQRIVIVEGEKDADRLAAAGIYATTNPMGAKKWKPEYTPHFRDARVVIIPDNDEPGRAHANQVAAALHGTTASVAILALPGLPEKGDVSDWLDAGHTITELGELVVTCPQWTPASAADAGVQERAVETARAAVPTVEFLSDADLGRLPPLEYDVDQVLPSGGLSFLVGPQGSGKTLLALAWALSIRLNRPWYGRAVLAGGVDYIAAEGARSLGARLDCWKSYHGIPPTQESGIRWIPRRVVLADPAHAEAYIHAARGVAPRQVIIDTLPRCTQGISENDADGMGRALEAADRIREQLGCGVLLITHPSREGGDNPRGHSSQESAADAVWALKEQDGARVLTCTKLKDGDESQVFSLALVQHESSVLLLPPDQAGVQSLSSLTPGQRVVLAIIRDIDLGSGVPVSSIVEAGRIARSSVHFVLKGLHSKDLVWHRGQKYGVTPTGLVQLVQLQSSGVSSDF